MGELLKKLPPTPPQNFPKKMLGKVFYKIDNVPSNPYVKCFLKAFEILKNFSLKVFEWGTGQSPE